mmetsp:Transcript_10768/g.17645  ORF Transcript_10768/g.17645 Transcript_10768/m.17645 type:complete len:339 (+) Transcript_10768:43-1059(+)
MIGCIMMLLDIISACWAWLLALLCLILIVRIQGSICICYKSAWTWQLRCALQVLILCVLRGVFILTNQIRPDGWACDEYNEREISSSFGGMLPVRRTRTEAHELCLSRLKETRLEPFLDAIFLSLSATCLFHFIHACSVVKRRAVRLEILVSFLVVLSWVVGIAIVVLPSSDLTSTALFYAHGVYAFVAVTHVPIFILLLVLLRRVSMDVPINFAILSKMLVRLTFTIAGFALCLFLFGISQIWLAWNKYETVDGECGPVARFLVTCTQNVACCVLLWFNWRSVLVRNSSTSRHGGTLSPGSSTPPSAVMQNHPQRLRQISIQDDSISVLERPFLGNS